MDIQWLFNSCLGILYHMKPPSCLPSLGLTGNSNTSVCPSPAQLTGVTEACSICHRLTPSCQCCHSSTAQDPISRSWNSRQCSITALLSKQSQMAPPCQGQQRVIKLSEPKAKSAWAAQLVPFLIPRNKLSPKKLQRGSWRGHWNKL